MSSLIIKNGKVWDGEDFFVSDVLIDGEKTIKIQKNITESADYIYDAKGKIVSAGLVDVHTHIKGLSPDNFGFNAEMSSFPFGVTAVNDAGSMIGDKAYAELLSVKNTVFVGSKIKNNHIDFDFTEKLLKRFAERAIGIKTYLDSQITQAKDITPLKELCDYAVDKGLKVMVHCSNSPVPMEEITYTLSCGDIMTHIYHGGEHSCVKNDFEVFKAAKKKGIILDTGFAGHVHTDFGNLMKAIKRGFIPDTISTDITKLSAYVRGGRYGMTMCMSMAREAGMSEEEIFKAVTSKPAKALGKENEWGYIKEGRKGDIVVFDYTDEGFSLTDKAGNNLKSNMGYRCVLTVLNGKIVYRD